MWFWAVTLAVPPIDSCGRGQHWGMILSEYHLHEDEMDGVDRVCFCQQS